MALALFLVADGASPAQAQVPSTIGETVWTGTLTVQDIGHYLGCNKPRTHSTDGSEVSFRNTDFLCSVHLSPHTFTHGGTSYEIELVALTAPDASVGTGQSLGMIVSKPLPTDWTLVVGGDTWLSLQDANIIELRLQADTSSSRRHISWRDTDFSWTAMGGTVTLSLVAPRTDVPTVSLSASPNPVLEGDALTLSVTLSAPLTSTVAIPIHGHGLVEGGSSISIAAGQTTGNATFSIAEDDDGDGSIWTEGQYDEVLSVELSPDLPVGVLPGTAHVKISVIDNDVPLPTVALSVGPRNVIDEGEDASVAVRMSRRVHGDVNIPLRYTPGTAEPADYSGPLALTINGPLPSAQGTITIPEDGDTDELEDFTVSIDASALPNWLTAGSVGSWGTSYTVTIHDTDAGPQQVQGQDPGTQPQRSQPPGQQAPPTATPTPTATATAQPQQNQGSRPQQQAPSPVTPTPTATPTPVASPLTAPALTAKVKAGENAVELSWEAVPGAVRYELQVWWYPLPDWQPLGGTDRTSYTHSGLTAGRKYYYTIRAVNAAGEKSDWQQDFASATVPTASGSPLPTSTPTPTPTPVASPLTEPALTAKVKAGENAVELSWEAVPGAVRYELQVWWYPLPDWQPLGGTDRTSYTHSGLTAGRKYYYTIRAVNAAGEKSDWQQNFPTATVPE